MSALHFIAPSSATTSSELVGILRLVTQHIGGSHEIVVLGSESDAKMMRQYGITVVGSIAGVKNKSRTLAAKIKSFIDTNAKHQHVLYAWGWRSVVALSCVDTTKTKIGMVDEVDPSFALASTKMVIMTPCAASASFINQQNVAGVTVAEPIVGLKPRSLVLDRSSVRHQLNVTQEVLIAVLGVAASPHSILEMIARLDCASTSIVFALPSQYKFRSSLIKRLASHGFQEKVRVLPPSLRNADVVCAADAAWAPLSPEYETCTGVLQVLSAAWEGTPLAVSSDHPSIQIPTIGQRLAWAKDDLDICAWFIDLHNNRDAYLQVALELAHRVRAIAAPTRFIDGFLMRLPSAARF